MTNDFKLTKNPKDTGRKKRIAQKERKEQEEKERVDYYKQNVEVGDYVMITNFFTKTGDYNRKQARVYECGSKCVRANLIQKEGRKRKVTLEYDEFILLDMETREPVKVIARRNT